MQSQVQIRLAHFGFEKLSAILPAVDQLDKISVLGPMDRVRCLAQAGVEVDERSAFGLGTQGLQQGTHSHATEDLVILEDCAQVFGEKWAESLADVE
jgi:hypothetical protein